MTRQLFLTVGAPASGKSTFLKQHDLLRYTISPDELRPIVTSPAEYLISTQSDKSGTYFDTDYQYENAVWKFLYQLLEQRMQKGQTVFVDATHLFRAAFNKYRVLAKKYHYDITLIDFMPKRLNSDTDMLTELNRRDDHRGRKIEPVNDEARDKVMTKFIDRYHSLVEKDFDGLTYVSPDYFVAKYLAPIQPLDFNQYDTIQIIGDVHGDLGALEQVFENHHTGVAYIFVGDYLDRGHKNVETFRFLQSLKANNIYLLEGNHEIHWRQWVESHKKHGRFGSETLQQLIEAGITDQDLDHEIDRLLPYLYFTFDGQSYFVSHAGIEPANWIENKIGKPLGRTALSLKPDSTFINGLAAKQYTPYDRDVDAVYNTEANTNKPMPFPYNIHGHRNAQSIPIGNGLSRNLTCDDFFRWVTITNTGIENHEIKSIDGETLVDKINHDVDVNDVDLENGLVAHNFSKDTFYGHRWTPITMKARGFFTNGNHIAGRGFEKFFNLNENPQATLDSLSYPVNIYNKWNGYLAIAFIEDGQFHLLPKSGRENTWRTKQHASQVLMNMPDLTDKLRQWLKQNPETSVTLEVIAPSLGDSHIIVYEHDTIQPLAVINNETGTFNPDGEKFFNITPISVAHNITELRNIIKSEVKDVDEGIVLRGANGQQLKVKTNYYRRAKEVRQRLDKIDVINLDAVKWPCHGREMFDWFVANDLTFSAKNALKYHELFD